MGTVTSTSTTDDDARHRTAILVLCCLAQFMVILDVAIVNVALPSIQADLHFTGADLQWVVNAYTLAFAGFLMLGGRAADLLGQVPVETEQRRADALFDVGPAAVGRGHLAPPGDAVLAGDPDENALRAPAAWHRHAKRLKPLDAGHVTVLASTSLL